MDTLFDIPQTEPQPQPMPTATCRTCAHRERWQCGGSVIQYCNKRKSNRTDNGLLKIKCKQQACGYYYSDSEQ